MAKRLCKSRKNKMIDGVCGGIAEYFNIDATIIRIIAVIVACLNGVGILAYIIACVVMPYSDSQDFENASDEEIDKLKRANQYSGSGSKSSENHKKNDKKNTNENSDKHLHTDEEFDSYFNK